MASFSDELREASRALVQFRSTLNDTSGSGAGRGFAGGIGGSGPFLAASGPAGIALASGAAALRGINAAAEFATPAANAYAVTGSSAALSSAVTQSILGSIGNTSLGGFALAATGLGAAQTVNQRAGDQVLGVTRDLARFGIEVNRESRERLVREATAQQARVLREEAEVQALTGSAEALKNAKPAGAGDTFDAGVAVLERIEALLRSLGGGRST